MTKRFEYKYIIPETTAYLVRKSLLPFMTLDPYCASRQDKQYPIHSIYFDTFAKDAFYEKLDGVSPRTKIRIRLYEMTSKKYACFLETKTKNGNLSIKERESLSLADHKAFMEKAVLKKHTSTFCQKISKQILSTPLMPVARIFYLREAYNGKFQNHLRVNFDRNVSATLNTSFFNTGIAILKNMVIFEIKCQFSVPVWLEQIIYAYQLRRASISKYTASLSKIYV